MSAITTPIEPKSTCATKKASPAPFGIGLSQVTTLVPAAAAASAAGAIWSPALFDSITTFCFWVVAVVSISICPAAEFSGVGPMNSSVPVEPSSFAASCAPRLAWSKGRMPRNFGKRSAFTA